MTITKTNILSKASLKPENFAIPAVRSLQMCHVDGTFTSRRQFLDTVLSDCINTTRFVRNCMHKNDGYPLTEHMSDFGLTMARCAGVITDKNYNSGSYYLTQDAREFLNYYSDEDLKEMLISNWKSKHPVDLVARWRKANPEKTKVIVNKKNGTTSVRFTDKVVAEKYTHMSR